MLLSFITSLILTHMQTFFALGHKRKGTTAKVIITLQLEIKR